MCLWTKARASSITVRFSGVSEVRYVATVVGRAACVFERDFVTAIDLFLMGGALRRSPRVRGPPNTSSLTDQNRQSIERSVTAWLLDTQSQLSEVPPDA